MATIRGNKQQDTHSKGGVETDYDISTNGNVEAGDHAYIFIFGWQGPTGAVISGIEDDQGGTWELITGFTGENFHRIAIWRGTGMSGGATLTATLTFADPGTAGTFTTLFFSVEGMASAAANVADSEEEVDGSSCSTDSIITTAADTLIFAATFAIDNEPNSISTPAGWTLLDEKEAAFNAFSVVYREESATGTFSATWNFGGTANNPSWAFAAFETTGGGGGPVTLLKGTMSLLGVGL